MENAENGGTFRASDAAPGRMVLRARILDDLFGEVSSKIRKAI